jgi:hypothetical protein
MNVVLLTEACKTRETPKMSEAQTYTDKNGAQITVCRPHQLEYCMRCQMDFTEMNEEARAEAAIAAGQEPDDDFF